jgi:hypothetical protein
VRWRKKREQGIIKHWVQPLFHDNLNTGAYIVSEELNQDSDEKLFPKSNLFCPTWDNRLGGICHIYQAPAQLAAQQQN